MSNSSLVNRLQTELKQESHSKQLQKELNSKLQSEYDQLLKRLAEAENHIDQLRLGANVQLNRHFIVTHEHRYMGNGEPNLGAVRPPVRATQPMSSTTTANACVATEYEWDGTQLKDIEDEDTLLGVDDKLTQSVDPSPDHYTLDVNTDYTSHESSLGVVDHTHSAHPPYDETSSLSTDGDETCISQMSTSTIADRGSAESIQYAHLLKIKALQGKMAELKSKLNERGSSFDKVLAGLQEVQSEHRQLSEDIDDSQAQLELLKAKYRGRASKRIASSQQAIGNELSTLAGQLTDIVHLLQQKGEDYHPTTPSHHHTSTPSHQHTLTSQQDSPVTSPTSVHASQPHTITSPAALPLHTPIPRKTDSVENRASPLPGSSATESALHAQIGRQQSPPGLGNQNDLSLSSVVGSELSFDSSPYLPSRYFSNVSSTTDVQSRDQPGRSHDQSHDEHRQSHDQHGISHDGSGGVQGSHDESHDRHKKSHDQHGRPPHAVQESQESSSSSLEIRRPMSHDQSGDHTQLKSLGEKAQHLGGREAFVVQEKPVERMSSHVPDGGKPSVNPLPTSRVSRIPIAKHIPTGTTTHNPRNTPSYSSQPRALNHEPIPSTASTNHHPLYTPSHVSTEQPHSITSSHDSEDHPPHRITPHTSSHQMSGLNHPITTPSHLLKINSNHHYSPSQASDHRSTTSSHAGHTRATGQSGRPAVAVERDSGLAKSSLSCESGSGRESPQENYTALTVSAIDRLRNELEQLKEQIMRSKTPTVISRPHNGHTTHSPRRHSAHTVTPTPTHSGFSYSANNRSDQSYTPQKVHSTHSFTPHTTHSTRNSKRQNSSTEASKSSAIYSSSTLPSYTSVTASPPHISAHSSPKRTIHTERTTKVELSPEHPATRPYLHTPSRSVSETRTPPSTPYHRKSSDGAQPGTPMYNGGHSYRPTPSRVPSTKLSTPQFSGSTTPSRAMSTSSKPMENSKQGVSTPSAVTKAPHSAHYSTHRDRCSTKQPPYGSVRKSSDDLSYRSHDTEASSGFKSPRHRSSAEYFTSNLPSIERSSRFSRSSSLEHERRSSIELDDWTCPNCGGKGTSSVSVSPGGTQTHVRSHKCTQVYTSPKHSGREQLRSVSPYKESAKREYGTQMSQSPTHTGSRPNSREYQKGSTTRDRSTQVDNFPSANVYTSSEHTEDHTTQVHTSQRQQTNGTQVHTSPVHHTRDNGTQVYIAKDHGTQMYSPPGHTTSLGSGREEPSFAQVATSTPTKTRSQQSSRPLSHNYDHPSVSIGYDSAQRKHHPASKPSYPMENIPQYMEAPAPTNEALGERPPTLQSRPHYEVPEQSVYSNHPRPSTRDHEQVYTAIQGVPMCKPASPRHSRAYSRPPDVEMRDYHTRTYTPTRTPHTALRGSYRSAQMQTPSTQPPRAYRPFQVSKDHYHTVFSHSSARPYSHPSTPSRRERVVYVTHSPSDESEPLKVKGHSQRRKVKGHKKTYVVRRESDSDSDRDVKVVSQHELNLSEALQLAKNLKRRSRKMHGSLKELAKLHNF